MARFTHPGHLKCVSVPAGGGRAGSGYGRRGRRPTYQPAGGTMANPLLLGVDNNVGTDLTTLESPLQLNGLTTLGTLAVTGQNPGWDLNPAVTIRAGSIGVHPMPQNGLEVTAAGGTAVSVTADDGTEWMDPEPVLGVGVTVSTHG